MSISRLHPNVTSDEFFKKLFYLYFRMCKSIPFSLQYAVFYLLKCRVLRCKRPHIAWYVLRKCSRFLFRFYKNQLPIYIYRQGSFCMVSYFQNVMIMIALIGVLPNRAWLNVLKLRNIFTKINSRQKIKAKWENFYSNSRSYKIKYIYLPPKSCENYYGSCIIIN